MAAIAAARGALDVEQLALPGQVASPPGPVDLSAMYLMHHAFRRDLARFVAAAAATPVEDRACWVRLARRWAVFSSALHKHHHAEDAGLWPLLLERAKGDESVAVLTAMSAEHESIDPLLHTCGTALDILARTEDADARRELAANTAELRDRLAAHLAHEERDAMALVQAHLSSHDWQRLDEEHFVRQYCPREIPTMLAWVMCGLPRYARRKVPGGPLVRVAGRLLAWRFARADRRTFRYVPAQGSSRRDRVLTWVSRNVARTHTALFRASGGRFGHRFRGGDVLFLTVRGRHSGRLFTTPALHIRDGRDYVVAASNGGIDREPQWWLNLLADPCAEVETRDGRTSVIAEEAQGEERDRLWARLVEFYPGYEGYQASVSRRISVVRLRQAETA